MISDVDVANLAEIIVRAHRRGRLIGPFTDVERLDLDAAYAVQDAVLAARLAAGERPAGWKIGYTSAAMRAQMGVDRPNFGPLTDAMLLADGDLVGGHLVQPRVEPEIALVLAAAPRPGADREETAACVAQARCALEVVDSVWRDYRFRLEDNTADGSSAAYAVLGPVIGATDLSQVAVRLPRAGQLCGEGSGADALGHPVEALRWLAAELDRRGRTLRTGDVVLTGGLTAAVPLDPGGSVRAVFDGWGSVTVGRPPD